MIGMAITLIVNGYFRSGTSIFSKLIHLNNPNKMVFYEPLNPSLFTYLQKDIYNENKLDLHSFNVWEPYRTISKKDIRRIQGYYPLRKENYSTSAVLGYMDAINNLDRETILQTNRSEFISQITIRRYHCKYVQIIRDPLSVFRSMKLNYLEIGSIYKRFFKKCLYFILNNYAFEVYEKYKAVIDKLGTPRHDNVNFIFKSRLYLSFYLKFVTTWVMTNYYVFKCMDDMNKGHIIEYNNYMRNPIIYKNKFETYTSISLGEVSCIKYKNPKISKKEKDKFLNTLKYLGIENEYIYLRNKLMSLEFDVREYP